MAAAILAAAMTAPRVASAQAFVGANFAGGAGANILLEPPDTMGAPGIDHYVQFINGRFSIYNKSTGAQLSSISSLTFWNNAGVTFPNTDARSDPRIAFDPQSGRWFATQIDVVGGTTGNPNHFLLAVSNTSDPTQGFKGFKFTAASNFGDFDTLGLNADGVYLSTNNFALTAGNTDPPTNTTIVSIPKSDLLLPTPTIANRTQWTSESLDTEGNVVQPAFHFGPSTGHEALLGMNNTSTISIQRTNLFNTAQQTAGAATLSASTSIAVPPAPLPPRGRQTGTATIDAIDNRLSQVIQVGTTLWAAQGTDVGGHAGIQWYKFDEASGALLQSGTIGGGGGAGTFDAVAPSIAANPNGDVVIGYTLTGPGNFPSAAASIGSSGGGAGGTVSFGAPVILKPGTANYAGTRWGDYSATWTDPADPGIFWTNQEWATTGFNNWATQMTEIVIIGANEARWKSAASGSFTDSSSWFAGAAPTFASHVIFSRATPGTGYTVTLPSSAPVMQIAQLSVRQGGVTLNFNGGTLSVGGNLNVGESAGAPSLTLTNGAMFVNGQANVTRGTLVYQTGTFNVAGALNVGSLAQVLLTSGRDKTMRVLSMSVASGGKVDLSDDNMIVDYKPPTSPISSIRSLVAQGFAGGPWTGGGITSSTAAATAASAHHTALGYADAAALGSTSFGEQTVDDSSVLIRYTLAGDGNLDGTVDLTDFTFLAASFNRTDETWLQGDYNYDGNVDLTDFTFLASNFNQTLAAGGDYSLRSCPGSFGIAGSGVPEPSAFISAATLLSFGSVVTRRNRRRRLPRTACEFR